MAEFEYGEIVVEGKPLKDWLKSDEGLVNYKSVSLDIMLVIKRESLFMI